MPDGPKLKVITTADGKGLRIVQDVRQATPNEVSQQIPLRRALEQEVRTRLRDREGRAPRAGDVREGVRDALDDQRAEVRAELKRKMLAKMKKEGLL
ncbi:MAG TPA: hypothetical protein VEW42_03790 [Candidatus Eisenbacteria bacterium]|nr:hypothetical protein [Candidatus Eisenbacteria bacterium]